MVNRSRDKGDAGRQLSGISSNPFRRGLRSVHLTSFQILLDPESDLHLVVPHCQIERCFSNLPAHQRVKSRLGWCLKKTQSAGFPYRSRKSLVSLDKSLRVYGFFLHFALMLSKLGHCSSQQDRYNFPTPIVLNLNSKFIVDIGVLHGFISVMEEVYLSYGVCIWRVVLNCDCIYHRISADILNGRYYRSCYKHYRLRADLFTGPDVSVETSSLALKGKLLAVQSHDVATNLIDSVDSFNTPDPYRRKDVFQAAVCILMRELGQHHCFTGHGPNFVTFWLTCRTGCEPISRFPHKNHNRKCLDSKIEKFGLLLVLKLFADCFMGLGYESESLMTHVIGSCNELNVLALEQHCNCTLSA